MKQGDLPPDPVSVEVPPSLASSEPVERANDALWHHRIRPLEPVGHGGSGSVLRGTDLKLRRDIAIKVTSHPCDELPAELLARFVAEAQITAQLEHPNVVPIHDLGIDPEGHAYFSMKLVRGQSLEMILAKRRAGDPRTLSEFGMRRLLDVFLQVCQAVEYAHARGVIHRDLKPANIMVGDFGEVLVMDWGIAKLVGRDDPPASPASAPSLEVSSVRGQNRAFATAHGMVFGTPLYMAPEQARAEEVDERSDLYSLGVILYEILCGEVPFDSSSDDLAEILVRLQEERPRPPSRIDPRTPRALETLALRLLEKDRERRALSLRQVRSLVHDHIEGIGLEYRRERLWTDALWVVGALALFAFLVWYLTGQSVATVIALTPSAAFNALGWFLLMMALGYPLWAATTSFTMSTEDHDPFRPPSSEELFVSSYLAHRTFCAAVAPLFQLVFVGEVLAAAFATGSPGALSQIRAEAAHALIIVIVFLFAYLFLLSIEVRMARRIDRYLRLVRRPGWESVWPFLLILVVLATVVAVEIIAWAPGATGANAWAFVRDRILIQRLQPFEIVKTLVFQGTFQVGLVIVTVLLAFPFSELLASLRMVYQPVDQASVTSRQRYFLRSLAVFRIVRTTFLYAGAMIGSLTAVTILSGQPGGPLVAHVIYVLGPPLLGFAGFALMGRYSGGHVARAPALRRMLEEQLALARVEHARADLDQLRSATWRRRLLQVAVPIACVVGYLAWSGSGMHQEALRKLIVPVSTEGRLLILPYVLLIPLLLVRDHAHLWILGRRVRAARR